MRLIGIATCLAIALFQGYAISADPSKNTEAAVGKAQVLEQKAADKQSVTAAPQVKPITKSEAQAVDPAGKGALDDPLTCLSRTIFWEAKGGTAADMEAVASVVLNRVGHEGFPGTVCEVVKQGSKQHACQFSWWCDGRSNHVDEDAPYTNAKEVARKALNQQLPDRTGGAMYFHSRKVKPDWARKYIKTAETEKFLFYKPHDGTAK
jgi:spore germination cell wall hydrolase CwlJ-like protein